MNNTSILLQPLDGQWEHAGKDRFAGIEPQGVRVGANGWGFDTASFTLQRDFDLLHPDLLAATPIEIDEAGTTIFEGWVEEPPALGDEGGIAVQCLGLQYHLDDKLANLQHTAILASAVLTNALQHCPLLDQRIDLIETSSYTIPDLTSPSLRTPRQGMEAANSYENWLLKIGVGKRLIYRALPTVPKYRVGSWAPEAFKGTSTSARKELFSEAISEWQDAAGATQRATRTAAQQPGGAETILVRRNITKSTVLQIPAEPTVAAAERLADKFLQQSMTTNLRGTLTALPGVLRGFSSGEEIHPRQLVQDVGELVHFDHLVHPDTGALGRDGRIVGVSSYEPENETAVVAIDSSRQDFEMLLAQHQATP